LQRAITDFAADQSFALARVKLQEHYGFMIGESTIQRIVLGHGRNMFEAGRPSLDFPKTPGRHKHIIAQTDGGMIPIVEPDPDQKDKRKGKKVSWREGKISLAHAKGSRTPVYAGTIEGGVETAGRQLLECSVRAGFGSDSHVHAVGDGAPWIVGQVEQQFGYGTSRELIGASRELTPPFWPEQGIRREIALLGRRGQSMPPSRIGEHWNAARRDQR